MKTQSDSSGKVRCFDEWERKVFYKLTVKVKEYMESDSLQKVELGIHKDRINQLAGTVSKVEKETEVLKVTAARKDTVITELNRAIDLSEADNLNLRQEIVSTKRKGNWKAVGFGIGGFSIGVGVGILIAVLR